MDGGGGGGASMDVASAPAAHSNNMVVAVRIRPLSPRESEQGAQKCCKVIKNKVCTSCNRCAVLSVCGSMAGPTHPSTTTA